MVRFRYAFVALVTAVLAFASPAHALSMMDPFNIPGAMDGGTAKVGDGIAYADGLRHKLDVYAPEQRGAAAPVVFFIYGGGWNRGERSDYQFVGRALAARGFVTVIADYRLVPEVRYPSFLEDNANALRWVQDNIANYGGDPNRLFLAGHSAGAYNAVMLALDPSFLREYGVTMPILAVGALSGPYDFYPFEYGEVREAFGQAPSPEGTQPINLITAEAPPMYLATGTSDPIVRMQNTERFAQRLREQGVWVTTQFYEGFGHMEPVIAMGALWRWRMPVLEDMTNFFHQFGAFPSGVPYLAVAPEAPEMLPDAIAPMDQIITQLDAMFQKIEE
ncbi:MAG: alpha/beta hydrolase [Devosia sp.]|jgi:acetyl esterase/lipase|uniref:alpha/beta hydrolase n=1 Tax=unclassified Devosia TaxID=196773 RepID=UPI0019DF208A|nr:MULTISPECIES: alpha/beta hydrolase [unclassified Devosia]MBF0679449.1 alpha/beta hydrolase [Devosia sp.]WEJ33782.1 alpha/beta hydrolase [Devosia sp. SD17-2]